MQGLPLSETVPWAQPPNDAAEQEVDGYPIKIQPQINKRVRTFAGEVWRLGVDAIVIGMNEKLTDHTGMNADIFKIGGPEFVEDCERQGRCQTAHATSTIGGGLPCRHVIHAVGPVYHPRFITASGNALHSAYRDALALAIDLNVRTLAISCIYLERKGFPRLDATHIALRTIRRFLEHHVDAFDAVILCMERDEDEQIHRLLMPVYFPRDVEDVVNNKQLLPDDIGNEWGEIVFEERKIPISAMPGQDTIRGRSGSNGYFNKPAAQGSTRTHRLGSEPPQPSWPRVKDMTRMEEDPDERKLKQLAERRRNPATPVEQQRARVESIVSRAKRLHYPDMANLQYIFLAGTDREGNRVVVIMGRNLNIRRVDMDRLAMHVVKTMERVAGSPYVILYVHTGVEDQNTPDLPWLKQVFDIFNYKYKQKLRAVYIYDWTWWLKIMMWALFPLLSSAFWDQSKFVRGVDELREFIDPAEAMLPPDLLN